MAVDIKKLMAENPDLRQIAERLKSSATKAVSDQKAHDKRVQKGEVGEKVYPTEHAVISEYYKGGQWESTMLMAQPGDENFKRELSQLIDRRDPDSIRVLIYRGKSTTVPPVITKDIVLSPISVPGADPSAIEEVKKLIEDAKKSFAEGKEGEGTLVQEKFARQLDGLQNTQVINQLKNEHSLVLAEKNRKIEELEEEVEDLEDELKEYDDGLKGANEALENKANPPMVSLLSAALENAGVNILKNNLKLTSALTGMEEQKIIELFAEQDKAKELPESTDSSSKGAITPKKDTDVQKERDLLIQFLKALDDDSFSQVYLIIGALQQQDGTLNMDLSKKVVASIELFNRKAAEADLAGKGGKGSKGTNGKGGKGDAKNKKKPATAK